MEMSKAQEKLLNDIFDYELNEKLKNFFYNQLKFRNYLIIIEYLKKYEPINTLDLFNLIKKDLNVCYNTLKLSLFKLQKYDIVDYKDERARKTYIWYLK